MVNYVAHQLKLNASIYALYDWEGRTIKAHRAQIREKLEFGKATVLDIQEMIQWLITEHLASDQHLEHLKVLIAKRFRTNKIEPPTNERMERLIRSACTTYEQQLFEDVLIQTPQVTRQYLDALEEAPAGRNARGCGESEQPRP